MSFNVVMLQGMKQRLNSQMRAIRTLPERDVGHHEEFFRLGLNSRHPKAFFRDMLIHSMDQRLDRLIKTFAGK